MSTKGADTFHSVFVGILEHIVGHLKPLYSGKDAETKLPVSYEIDELTASKGPGVYRIRLVLVKGINFETLQHACNNDPKNTNIYVIEPDLTNYGGLEKGHVYFRIVINKALIQ